MLEYTDAHLSESVTHDQLADVAGCSRFHFSRLFRVSAGSLPIEFLNKRRIEKAQELIRARRDMTLAAIASHCGFSDQSHTNRHFKRSLGVTPGAFAKKA